MDVFRNTINKHSQHNGGTLSMYSTRSYIRFNVQYKNGLNTRLIKQCHSKILIYLFFFKSFWKYLTWDSKWRPAAPDFNHHRGATQSKISYSGYSSTVVSILERLWSLISLNAACMHNSQFHYYLTCRQYTQSSGRLSSFWGPVRFCSLAD